MGEVQSIFKKGKKEEEEKDEKEAKRKISKPFNVKCHV